MNKNDLMMLMMAKKALDNKTLDYQKDPNPDNWVTMKGSHVHLENGKIDGGAGGKFNGQSYKGTKKQAHVGKSEAGNKTEEKPAENQFERQTREYFEKIDKENQESQRKADEFKKNRETARESLYQQYHELDKAAGKEKDPTKRAKLMLERSRLSSKFRQEYGMEVREYEDKYKEPEKKVATGSEAERYEAKQKISEIHKAMRKLPYNAERKKLEEQFHKLYDEYTEKFGIDPTSDHPKKPKAKPAAKKETKPEVGDKGMAFLKRMSVIHSSFDESTGYMARDVAEKLKEGKSLQEIKDYFYGNIEKWGSNKEQERKEVDHFIEAVKRADKGLDPWGKEPKLGAPKSPKKKIDPASTEAQNRRKAIADDVMKRPFVKGKVEEASKKLIAEANKDYGGDHETSVMLENVVKEKDGAYVTLKIVAKDKTGKSRFPQSHSMTFKVGDLTKEQKKLYFSK